MHEAGSFSVSYFYLFILRARGSLLLCPISGEPRRRDGVSQRVKPTRIAETWERSPGDHFALAKDGPRGTPHGAEGRDVRSLRGIGRKEGEDLFGRGYACMGRRWGGSCRLAARIREVGLASKRGYRGSRAL